MKSHVHVHASSRSVTRFAAGRLFAVLGLVLVLGCGIGLPAAHAQQLASLEAPVASLETREALSKEQLAWQLTSMLDYDIPNIRVQALQQVIFLAHGRDRGFDFTAAVPAILSIYENETDEAFRIMALSALNEIGDAHAMQRLDARVRAEPSKRVRLLTEVVLKGYYEARGQHYQAYNR